MITRVLTVLAVSLVCGCTTIRDEQTWGVCLELQRSQSTVVVEEPDDDAER